MMDSYELHLGDSLRALEAMADASVDGVVTDPPYCSVGTASQATGAKYVQTGTKLSRPDFAGDGRDARSWLRWCTAWLSECLRIARPGSVLCVFTDWRQLPSLTDAVQFAGWHWQGVVSWDKTQGTRPRMGGFRAQCEYVVWASKGKLDASSGYTLPGSFTLPRTRDDRVHHQTSKPIALMRELVKIVPEGGVVLDPFAGSGTTGVAALLEGRRFVGVELVPEIHQIASSRLAQLEAA